MNTKWSVVWFYVFSSFFSIFIGDYLLTASGAAMAFNGPLPSKTPQETPIHTVSAHETIQRKCVVCHYSDRFARKAFPIEPNFTDDFLHRNRQKIIESVRTGMMPKGIVFGLAPEIRSESGSLIQQAEADSLLEQLETMKSPQGKVYKSILFQTDESASCDPGDQIAQEALQDLNKFSTNDRKNIRYISLSSTKFKTQEDKDLLVQALNKLINSVSNAKDLAKLEPIGPYSQLLRLDLKKYGLEASRGQLDNALNAYGISDSAPGYRDLKTRTGSKNPIYRADQFVAKVSKPPLYHTLQRLPDRVGDLKRQLSVDRNEKGITSMTKNSGVSNQYRGFAAMESKDGRLFTESYDFLGRSDGGDGGTSLFKDNFSNVRSNGGEFIWEKENGMLGFYISISTEKAGLKRQNINDQKRIDEAPTEVVQAHFRPDKVITNGQTCFGCHANGFLPKADELRKQLSETLNGSGRTRALASYKSDDSEMNQKFIAANDRYRSNLEKIGVTAPFDPINSIVSRFEEKLNLDDLACELGTSPGQLRADIEANNKLSKGKPLLKNRGQISRNTALQIANVYKTRAETTTRSAASTLRSRK